jgi:carboxylate-amine ligase
VELRERFDSAPEYTVGVEEEIMLLSREDLSLVPRAREVLELLDGDPRFKLELPASQVEIVTPPLASAVEVGDMLAEGRRVLAERAGGLVAFAAAGAHPFSPGVGELNQLPRYESTIREHGGVARRQLVCALQVHVSVGSAERALAVYNAARSYLPLIAALGANAPFYEGRDTGLASVRPKISELLPRQGVPPAIESWEAYAAIFQWGASAGWFGETSRWWWELRLHPTFGTLEFRVPDAQSTIADGVAIASLIHSLVVWLGGRHDAGERLAMDATWRIEQNRWSACRYGVEGEMADLSTGAVRPTRQVLSELLDELEPIALRLGAAVGRARELVEVNGAIAQRRVVGAGGVRAVAEWLVERFLG